VTVKREWLFDRPWTREFTKVRQEFVTEMLGSLRKQVDLNSALDVGCGVGDFAKFLSDMGFCVIAADGRSENVSEAQRRYPNIKFLTADVENLTLEKTGRFDLVLCFGLLYHLENPFRALRNLHGATDKVLLIETMCVPGAHAMMDLLDEGVAEDQALNYVAFYPTEPCLIKILYRVGFPFVYLFDRLPSVEFYSSSLWRKRPRTMMVASKVPLKAPELSLVREPMRPVHGDMDPWGTGLWKLRVRGAQLKRLIGKPFRVLKESVTGKKRGSGHTLGLGGR
jgi:SAM-dependent methyltransferase